MTMTKQPDRMIKPATVIGNIISPMLQPGGMSMKAGGLNVGCAHLTAPLIYAGVITSTLTITINF